jgi:hypothetical protein
MLEWDRIPAYIGLWWVHLVLLLIIFLLLFLPSLNRRMLAARPG